MTTGNRSGGLVRWGVVSRTGSAAEFAVASMTAAAFGPYLGVAGIRTEQVAVYGVFATCVLLCLWWRTRPTGPAVAVTGAWLVTVAVAVIGSVQPPSAPDRFGLGDPVAGFDNLALPVAAACATLMLATVADPRRLLRVACAVLVAAVCANAVVAVWSINADLTWLLRPFWAGGAGLTTAEKAQMGGRFGGIFNQPAEAGQVYAVALAAAVWLLRDRMLLLAGAAATITVGGIVAASKIFLLLGVPVVAWQLMRVASQRQRHLVGLACVTVAVAGAARLGVGADWAGGHMVTAMLHGDGAGYGPADLYTAGRFGERSTLRPAVEAILSASPWFGFGIGGILAAYDNAWLEVLAVSGLFGVAAYTAVLVVLARTWWRRRATVDKAWSQFSGGLIIVLVGASVGLPALTGNRVATVSWLLVTLLLLCQPPKTEPISASPVTRAR